MGKKRVVTLGKKKSCDIGEKKRVVTLGKKKEL